MSFGCIAVALQLPKNNPKSLAQIVNLYIITLVDRLGAPLTPAIHI